MVFISVHTVILEGMVPDLNLDLEQCHMVK